MGFDVNNEATASARGAARICVGREWELQHVDDALENMVRGTGQVVLVSRDPGIGKRHRRIAERMEHGYGVAVSVRRRRTAVLACGWDTRGVDR